MPLLGKSVKPFVKIFHTLASPKWPASENWQGLLTKGFWAWAVNEIPLATFSLMHYLTRAFRTLIRHANGLDMISHSHGISRQILKYAIRDTSKPQGRAREGGFIRNVTRCSPCHLNTKVVL